MRQELFNAGPSQAGVFRPWRSFPTMVASGLVVGFATGGFPAYSKEISQVALVLGMTFSLTEISIAGISPRTEGRRFQIAFAMSYVVLSGLILTFAVLLIGVPLVASRFLRPWPRIVDLRASAVSISFFFLVVAIAGSTRAPLLAHPELIATLAVLSFGRTFLLGGLVFVLTRALHVPWAERVAVTAFSSFKNLGLTVVLAFAVFGPVATLPSIVSLVFEILWLAALPLLFRGDLVKDAAYARRS